MFRPFVPAVLLVALAALAPSQALTQTFGFTQTITSDGLTVTVSNTFTVDTTTQTLSGTGTLIVVNSAGQTLVSKTFTITDVFGTNVDVNFKLSVPAGNLAVVVSCNVDISAHTGSCTVSADLAAGPRAHVSPE